MPVEKRRTKLKNAVAYYRVSTERQGRSGLGLEAQQAAVTAFALANGYSVTTQFTEIESGKKNNRPVLLKALETCKAEKAILLIAKLDRLGRNVAFISQLIESNVDFKAVDNPFACKLMVHIMVAVAEHERDLTSERTIAALKAAKERGIELGKFGRYIQSAVNKRRAEAFADDMHIVIRNLRTKGFCTLRALTDELNRLQVPTYRNDGSKWHPSSLHKLIKRAGRQQISTITSTTPSKP